MNKLIFIKSLNHQRALKLLEFDAEVLKAIE